MVQYWFQAKLKSKYVSVVALVAYTLMSAYKIFLLIIKAKIYWFALSQSIDFMVIAVALLIIYKKIGTHQFRFSKDAMMRMWKKSKHYIVSSLMITIFVQTDRIMIKLMVGDEANGYYASAVNCSNITSFVFAALIDSFRPSIFEAKKSSESAFKLNMTRLYSIIIYVSLAQCVVITLGAPLIIKLLYGSQYAPASPALRLIVWYTTFSYLGSVRNIWILSENKQKYLWILNLSGALMNVALNAVLIPTWGIMGASFASLVTQIFTNVIMNILVYPIRENNVLMWKSLNPKVLFDMVNILLKKKKPQAIESAETEKKE
jgi:O-antigen/teichoic acid export membrane protein